MCHKASTASTPRSPEPKSCQSRLTTQRKTTGLHFQICSPRLQFAQLLSKIWKFHGLTVNPGKFTRDGMTHPPSFTDGTLRLSEAMWLSQNSGLLLPYACPISPLRFLGPWSQHFNASSSAFSPLPQQPPQTIISPQIAAADSCFPHPSLCFYQSILSDVSSHTLT